MSSPLLRIEGLRKSFPMGGGSIEVLRGIDLTIRSGERIAVLGDSGVGKSTLLHIMGTLDRPTSGRVLYRDHLDLFSLQGIGLLHRSLRVLLTTEMAVRGG